jgi:hypothetical protein
MKAGRTYVIDMKARTPGFDPFLRLEDPDGKQVAFDDDGGGNLDARIVYRAPRDGVHRIICTTFRPRQTGGYVLTVQEVGPPAGKQP